MQLKIQERAVLQMIETGRATSQTQLARVLNLRQNTVHSVLSRLEKSGLVYRGVVDKGHRGRPIQHYETKKEGAVLVIQWLGSEWSAGIFVNRKIRGTVYTFPSRTIKNADEAFRALRETRDTVLKKARFSGADLSGIVLYINASRTTRDRVFSSSVIPWIREVSEEDFTKALNSPVQLNLGTPWVLPELRLRAPSGVSSLVILNIGDGVSAHGASIDKDWGSERRYKGEIGHVVVDPKGPVCGCGHRGCLEALISGPKLLQRVECDVRDGVQTLLADVIGKSPVELFVKLEQLSLEGSDSYATTLVEEFLERAAWAAGLIINLIGPDVIVLNGYALEGRDHWRERIAERARNFILHGESADIRMEFPMITKEEVLSELAKTFKVSSTTLINKSFK